MSSASYWGSGPGDPGRPVLKFTKLKPPAMQVSPTPCALCKKPFYQFVHLQQHSRCHSGRRPFKCHPCNRSFMQLAHLMKHRVLKHEVQKKCRSCGSMYSRWSTFLRHTIQTHGAKALALPKVKRTVKTAAVEKAPKISIKLCIKKSDITMAEDTKTESRKAKKRKKHKKHKKESKKLKQSKQDSPSKSDIKVQSAESKPRIILKFKMPKDNCEKQSESLQAANSEESKVPAGAAATPANKTEAFTELVQSPSPKDSGIDDCSPLHETDHHENCSSNAAGAKSGDGNKQSKDITTPATSTASSPNVPLSLSTSPTISASSPPPPVSPRRPTRQDALLRHLMSAKDTPHSSAPSTPDNCRTADSCVVRKARSSHVIKREVCNSPRNRSTDIPATPSPHRSIDPDYAVPPSPVPSLKITISKKPAGKLRGTKYTSSLHVPDMLPPASPSESIASKSPRSTCASPRGAKRQHSPFKAYRNVPDSTEAARLIYSPDASMSSSRSPRQAGKSPKLYRMESSDTVYSTSHRSSLSPPHSLKSERDFGALNVDIDDDPYAFDDEPCNNSPHLLPYSSTLQRRADKYKLDPPVLEPQILPAISEPSDAKHKTRPKLTKQVDLKKQRVRKSPARSLSSKEVKASRTPRSGRRGKIEEPMPVYIKQEVIEDSSSQCDDPMPTLTRNVESTISGRDSVQSSKPVEEAAKTVKNKPEYCRVSESITNTLVDSSKCSNLTKLSAEPVQEQSCSSVGDHKEQSSPESSFGMPSLTKCAETTSKKGSANAGKHTTEPIVSSAEKTTSMEAVAFPANVPMEPQLMDSKSQSHYEASAELPVNDVKALCEVVKDLAETNAAMMSVEPPAPEPSKVDVPVVPPEVTASPSPPAPPAPPAPRVHVPPHHDTAMDDMTAALNDSDLLLSDPQLENLSFNDSFLELGDDVGAPVAAGEALFDDLHESTSTLHTLETASKASSLDINKRKVESDPIVVTVPGEAGMEPISLVIENEDSDHFGESDDDDFDLASLSSAPLAMTSLSASHSSTRSMPRGPPVNATAAIIDTDSEFADLQSSGASVNSQVAAKPPITGFFNAFASFVSAKQPTDTRRASPGYCNEFAKFISQKCEASEDEEDDEEEEGSELSNGPSDGKNYTRCEIRALKQGHIRVRKLSEQIWHLLQTVFPFLELPTYRSGSSPCGVEALMDQVMGFVNDQDSVSDEQSYCPPSVSLCTRPDQCLARLRTKVCELLVTVLPDLSLPSSFSQTGTEVDMLVEQVIASNVT